MFGQYRLDIAKSGARAYRENEIRWFVVDDARQVFGREDAVNSLREISQVQRGAAADRGDCLAKSSGCSESFRGLLRIGGSDELGGARAVDGDGMKFRLPTSHFRLPTSDFRLAITHGCLAS